MGFFDGWFSGIPALKNFRSGNVTVYYRPPATPATALMTIYHGRGGSSRLIVGNAEWKKVMEAAYKAGYYVVVAESENRDAKEWDKTFPDFNNDIDSMQVIINTLVEKYQLPANLPHVLLGHSDGGNFVPIYAHTIQARAILCAKASGWPKVHNLAAYVTPTMFICGAKDTVVLCSKVSAAYSALVSRNIRTVLIQSPTEDHYFKAANLAEIMSFIQ